MRVLFIRQNYPPERGPFRYVFNLAVDLAARGYEITVFTGLPHYPDGKPYGDYGKYKPRMDIEDGVKVVRLPLLMASNRQPFKRILGFFAFALIIIPALLFCRKPDIMVCSVPPVTVAIAAYLASKFRGIPLVMMLHDFEPLRSLELRGIIKYPFARSFVRFFTRLYSRSRAMVVANEDECDALIGYGAESGKIRIIPHGINVEKFDKLAEIRSPFIESGENSGKTALYLGTVGMAHDIEAVVKAFAYNKIRDLPVDFVIVGDGECLPKCVKLIKNSNLTNVRIFPPVDMDLVPGILSQADILVISHKPRSVTLGSKFCEYMAAGKPLLANSDGILSRTVEIMGNGWVFNAKEPESLYKCLMEFLSSPASDLNIMKQKSRSYARAHLASDVRHDEWEQLLMSLL
jgi:glycosyltransferase involved in cell wall biosynthesis